MCNGFMSDLQNASIIHLFRLLGTLPAVGDYTKISPRIGLYKFCELVLNLSLMYSHLVGAEFRYNYTVDNLDHSISEVVL